MPINFQELGNPARYWACALLNRLMWKLLMGL